MVEMQGPSAASYDGGIGLFRIEIKDLCNLVIDPNQKVGVLAHDISLESMSDSALLLIMLAQTPLNSA